MKLLSVTDVAGLLSVSKRTVWRLTAAGVLPPPIRVTRRVVRWRAEEIAENLAQVTSKKPRLRIGGHDEHKAG